MVILLFISCPVSIIAQTDYYYYRGGKIPLTVNESKICVNIPNNKEILCEGILKEIKIIDKIKDADFDISIVQKSDLTELSSSRSWKEGATSVILSPCYKTMDGKEVFSTPYLNVRLKKEEDLNLLLSYAEKYGLRIVKQDSFLPLWYILSVSSETGKTALEIANTLWESGVFTSSVPDLCSDDMICSNDPLFNQQWGLHNNTYTGIDISIESAWNYATGKNIKIAILDKGVDTSHVDLASNIGSLSFDTETGTSPSVLYGDHGTHCAGIAAAIKDNDIQIAGVAPNATIISISNSLNVTTNSRLKRADGIIWAFQNGADIISNSWTSSTYHEAIDEAVQEAFSYGRQGKGCVIVFASGNGYSNNLSYPANCNDTILAVGAIGNTGARASFSNYGTKLDLVAPGVDILSTLPNDQTGYMSGTSMACPHVAGVAALVLERNSELTVNQVNSIINSNAKKIPGINFNVTKPDGLWNIEYGYGLADAYNSVINTPSNVYIQNEVIMGNRVISADSIFVGKNVTDDKPYGNVTLGQGEIILKASYIEIKNSTTVPLGTTLKIVN